MASVAPKLVRDRPILLLKGSILMFRGRWADAESVGKELVNTSSTSLALRGQELILLARAQLALMLVTSGKPSSLSLDSISALITEATNVLRSSEDAPMLAYAYIQQSTFWIARGDLNYATKALKEAEGITQTGPLLLFEADIALRRALIIICRSNSFAPLSEDEPNGAPTQSDGLVEQEVNVHLNRAAQIIESSGYKIREPELASLRSASEGTQHLRNLLPFV